MTKPVLPAMLAALIGAAAMGFNAAVAAPIYATSLVAASNVTPFGSGIVTGPPDIGGLWLGSTFDPPALLGSLTVGFATPLADGPGIDLTVVDVGSAPWETFTVEVSSDNVAFTLLGEFSATNNAVDFSGLFAGPVRYVRLTNTSDEYSADIDTLFGNYAAPNPVPEPGTLALVACALAALCIARSRASSGRHFGAIRIAPSSRITSPFNIGFSMICRTSDANSSGRPSRGGNGTILPSDSAISGGIWPTIGVSNIPGAIDIARMP